MRPLAFELRYFSRKLGNGCPAKLRFHGLLYGEHSRTQSSPNVAADRAGQVGARVEREHRTFLPQGPENIQQRDAIGWTSEQRTSASAHLRSCQPGLAELHEQAAHE